MDIFLPDIKISRVAKWSFAKANLAPVKPREDQKKKKREANVKYGYVSPLNLQNSTKGRKNTKSIIPVLLRVVKTAQIYMTLSSFNALTKMSQ